MFTLKNNTKTITTQLNVPTNEIIVTIGEIQTKLNINDLFSDTLNCIGNSFYICK